MAARGWCGADESHLERVFIDLRALVGGTDRLDPNRAYAVDLAVVISQAIERTVGEQ